MNNFMWLMQILECGVFLGLINISNSGNRNNWSESASNARRKFSQKS